MRIRFARVRTARRGRSDGAGLGEPQPAGAREPPARISAAAGIAMAFLGFQSLLAGWLMLRAEFPPRVLGVLSILGGCAWVTHAWSPLGYRLGQFGLLVGVVGVLVEMFWFLGFGVNEQRWREQARANRDAT